MRKKYIQLGAVLLVLAGLIAALLLLKNAPDKDGDGDTAPENAVTIGSGEAAFNSVEISNESGEYEIVKSPGDSGDFTIKGWEKLSLDTYNLGLARDNAKEMPVKEIIAESISPDALADFGLDAPRARAKINYESAAPGVILFGDNAPGGEGVYVMTEGDSTVFLVSPAAAEPFLKPATAYVNTTVTETDSDFKGFDRVSLSGADYPEPIIIERAPEGGLEAAGMSFGTHRIVSPLRADVDYQRGMTPLNSVYGLTADDVVAVVINGESLAPYGLDEPAAVISVTAPADAPGLSFTLKISREEAGYVYLMKDGSPVVYEVSASSLPFLGLGPFDLMDRTAVMPNINDVSSVTVSAPSKTYVFTLSGEGDDLTVSLNGATLPDAADENGGTISGARNFREFYQTLISASYDEETGESPSQDAEPLLRIAYSYKNGGQDVVRFYAGPVRRAFIETNGGPWYLTSSSYVDRVMESAGSIALN